MPGNAQLLAQFRLEQERRNLSAETIKTRNVVLTAFARWLNRPLAVATTEHVQTWLDGCRISPRSRSSYLACMAAYYRWAVAAGRCRRDPIAEIRRPKLRRLRARPLLDPDIAHAITQADRRMRAWLCLGAYAGFRCKEIAGLQRQDILEHEGLLIVSNPKGDSGRVLALNPVLLSALVDYGMPRTGYVFLSRHRRPFAPKTVSDKVARYLRSVGVEGTEHRLRHSFGTSFYRRSRDIRLTQEVMGHRSLDTTAIYTEVDVAESAPVIFSLGSAVWLQPALPLPV